MHSNWNFVTFKSERISNFRLDLILFSNRFILGFDKQTSIKPTLSIFFNQFF